MKKLETIQLAAKVAGTDSPLSYFLVGRCRVSQFRRCSLLINAALATGGSPTVRLKLFTASGAKGGNLSLAQIDEKVLLYAWTLDAIALPGSPDSFGEHSYQSLAVSLDQPLDEIFLFASGEFNDFTISARVIGEPLEGEK